MLQQMTSEKVIITMSIGRSAIGHKRGIWEGVSINIDGVHKHG